VATLAAILFDADGVIQNSKVDDLSVLVARSLGFLPEDLEDFVNDIIEAERPALAGQVDFADVLEPLLAARGASGKAAEFAAEWACSIDADASVLSLIGKLRQQGLCCALATNQQSYRAKYMRQTLGYDRVFERSFYSHELGFMKPDVRYFEAIVARLPFSPEQVLFIDDLAKNIAAARTVGLHAEQFVHPRNTDGVAQLKELLERYSVVVHE
jgi:putative hydrolase of the HAD superfamily